MYMKKAAFYARVSTSLQEEKGTIDSQKNELIRQIKNDGNILVKEYIDNGWSGARLDRPALDELRGDLKTDLFEVIYFLDSDRIARDVSYQNIIIAELLKYNKDIIIKGKNYIHNPENKFSLTVLGAVNELEKAKIIERTMRGRREKARKGAVVDNGNMYGYKHIKKTDKRDGYYEIHPVQAEVVRFLFETYAHTDISLNGLVCMLEKKGILTYTGKSYWKAITIRNILKNTTYYGEHHFNKTERLESLEEKERYSKNVKSRVRIRDGESWIMVPVPPIITKELYDEVQLRLERNKKTKRNGGEKYVLSGMVKCGVCNHIYSGTEWKGVKYYKCNHRDKRHNHFNREDIVDCKNKAINGLYIENIIDRSIKEKILKPNIIRKYIDILRTTKMAGKAGLIKRQDALGAAIISIENKKKRVLDLYADSVLNKNEYIEKIGGIEQELDACSKEREELSQKICLLDKKSGITASIKQICKKMKKNYKKLGLDGKKFIVQKLISEIVLFRNEQQNKVIIRGFLPFEGTGTTSSANYYTSNAGDSVVRRTKRARTDYVLADQSGDRINFCHLERLVNSERRQYCRQRPGEQCFARTGRSAHDNIVSAGRGNFQSAFGERLSADKRHVKTIVDLLFLRRVKAFFMWQNLFGAEKVRH
jgi:site-specific DNA recombinase